jgi:glycosyltransferase involved in cell wall biosynthesis
MRILMVVDGQYPATGGAEMQARLLCTTFARQGHQVQVLAPRLQPSQAKLELVDGIAVRRLSYPRIKGVGAIWLDVRFAAFLLRHRNQFDVIHIHMVRNLAGAAGWVRRLVGIPMVAKVSGADEFRGGILDPALMHRPIHRLLNAGAKRIDAFQCISLFTRKAMLEAGYPSTKLHLLPNAVDCTRFACNRTEAPLQRVVFIGRHVAVKGIDVLLRAWALLQRPTGLRLILAGNGPEHDKLQALAHDLGVRDSVDFPGAVSNVPEILAGSGLYVQASHQEGLPNAVLEAMASGLAVVATRVSGHEDVVQHGSTGLLVERDNPEALAAAMQALLDDPGLRWRMGKAGRASIANTYCAEIITARLLRLYRGAKTADAGADTLSLPADGR